MQEIEYVDFQTARKYMDNGGRCRFNNKEYFIRDGDLYLTYLTKPMVTSLSLKMLDSKRWILL